MKKITFFSILLLLCIQSCKKESQRVSLENIPIIIDMDSVKKTSSLSISYVKYIPLETSDECLIGFDYKTLIKNNKIFVADFHTAMSLFVFDINGKFLFKIAKRGQGPGEYISFFDFDIQENGDIYIFDQHSKKILIFNSAGEHLRDINMVFILHGGFCLVSDKLYCSSPVTGSGKRYANLAVLDTMNNKTDFLLKDDIFLQNSGIIGHNSFDFYYSPDSIIYYSPKFSDIIYSIDKDGFHPAIYVKNLNIPSMKTIEEWMQKKNIRERNNYIYETDYFIENAYIYETDKYITFGCMRNKKEGFVLYNKHLKYASFTRIGIFFRSLGIDRVKGCTGKDFFGVIDFNSDNETHQRLLKSQEELASWKEDDNPVIVIFNFDM